MGDYSISVFTYGLDMETSPGSGIFSNNFHVMDDVLNPLFVVLNKIDNRYLGKLPPDVLQLTFTE